MSEPVSYQYKSASSLGIPVPKSMVRNVRDFIQDYPQTNETFLGEETSDTKIAKAILDTVEDWNMTPPVLNRKLEPLDLILNSNYVTMRPLIQLGASIKCLKSVMIKLARNDVPYTAGNVTLQANAVWRNLQAIIADLSQEYDTKKHRLKVSQNVNAALGGGGYAAALTEHYYGQRDDSIHIQL